MAVQVVWEHAIAFKRPSAGHAGTRAPAHHGEPGAPQRGHMALAHEGGRQLQRARRQPCVQLGAAALQARVRHLAARVRDAHLSAVLPCGVLTLCYHLLLTLRLAHAATRNANHGSRGP